MSQRNPTSSSRNLSTAIKEYLTKLLCCGCGQRGAADGKYRNDFNAHASLPEVPSALDRSWQTEEYLEFENSGGVINFEDYRDQNYIQKETIKLGKMTVPSSNRSRRPGKDIQYPGSSDDEDNDDLSTHSKVSRKKIKKGVPKKDEKYGSKGRNPWQPAEDEALKRLIKQHGKKWSVIARFLGNRTGKQIRDRFLNKLDPSITEKEWSPEEDQMVIRYWQQFGNRWSEIAKHLEGRTESMVKNRYYSYIAKKLLDKNGEIKYEEITNSLNSSRSPSPTMQSHGSPSLFNSVRQDSSPSYGYPSENTGGVNIQPIQYVSYPNQNNYSNTIMGQQMDPSSIQMLNLINQYDPHYQQPQFSQNVGLNYSYTIPPGQGILTENVADTLEAVQGQSSFNRSQGFDHGQPGDSLSLFGFNSLRSDNFFHMDKNLINYPPLGFTNGHRQDSQLDLVEVNPNAMGDDKGILDLLNLRNNYNGPVRDNNGEFVGSELPNNSDPYRFVRNDSMGNAMNEQDQDFSRPQYEESGQHSSYSEQVRKRFAGERTDDTSSMISSNTEMELEGQLQKLAIMLDSRNQSIVSSMNPGNQSESPKDSINKVNLLKRRQMILEHMLSLTCEEIQKSDSQM